MRVPKAGGEATLLVASASGHLAADDTNVYWNLGSGVSKVPLAGGSPTPLAPGVDGDITVNCGSVYWTAVENNVILARERERRRADCARVGARRQRASRDRRGRYERLLDQPALGNRDEAESKVRRCHDALTGRFPHFDAHAESS